VHLKTSGDLPPDNGIYTSDIATPNASTQFINHGGKFSILIPPSRRSLM